jgi:hypothetical protein
VRAGYTALLHSKRSIDKDLKGEYSERDASMYVNRISLQVKAGIHSRIPCQVRAGIHCRISRQVKADKHRETT